MKIQVRLDQRLYLCKRNLYIAFVHAVDHQNPIRRNFRTRHFNTQNRSDGHLNDFTFLDAQRTANLGCTLAFQIDRQRHFARQGFPSAGILNDVFHELHFGHSFDGMGLFKRFSRRTGGQEHHHQHDSRKVRNPFCHFA